MRISIFAVGTRMPGWVNEGVETYRQRLPRHIQLEVVEIPPGKRGGRGSAVVAVEREAEQLLRRAAPADLTIALDERGKPFSSSDLADDMRGWLDHVPHVALLIGGADGISERCKRDADQQWSLSAMTLPHGLVRVFVAEQLYRAWTIIDGHPYHRS